MTGEDGRVAGTTRLIRAPFEDDDKVSEGGEISFRMSSASWRMLALMGSRSAAMIFSSFLLSIVSGCLEALASPPLWRSIGWSELPIFNELLAVRCALFESRFPPKGRDSTFSAGKYSLDSEGIGGRTTF